MVGWIHGWRTHKYGGPTVLANPLSCSRLVLSALVHMRSTALGLRNLTTHVHMGEKLAPKTERAISNRGDQGKAVGWDLGASSVKLRQKVRHFSGKPPLRIPLPLPWFWAGQHAPGSFLIKISKAVDPTLSWFVSMRPWWSKIESVCNHCLMV